MLRFTYSRRRTLLEFAPLPFSLLAIVLIALALCGPVPLNTPNISFMQLRPSGSSRASAPPRLSAHSAGEGIWLGLRGSCFRQATGPIHCTAPAYEPVFNSTYSAFIDVANSPLMCARPQESTR